MNKIKTTLQRTIGGIKNNMTGFFMLVAGTTIPVGFALFLIYLQVPDAPKVLYWGGWVIGIIGITSFFNVLLRSFKEDKERKALLKKNDDNFRSVMKTIEAIKGQLKSVNSRLGKKK